MTCLLLLFGVIVVTTVVACGDGDGDGDSGVVFPLLYKSSYETETQNKFIVLSFFPRYSITLYGYLFQNNELISSCKILQFFVAKFVNFYNVVQSG